MFLHKQGNHPNGQRFDVRHSSSRSSSSSSSSSSSIHSHAAPDSDASGRTSAKCSATLWLLDPLINPVT